MRVPGSRDKSSLLSVSRLAAQKTGKILRKAYNRSVSTLSSARAKLVSEEGSSDNLHATIQSRYGLWKKLMRDPIGRKLRKKVIRLASPNASETKKEKQKKKLSSWLSKVSKKPLAELRIYHISRKLHSKLNKEPDLDSISKSLNELLKAEKDFSVVSTAETSVYLPWLKKVKKESCIDPTHRDRLEIGFDKIKRRHLNEADIETLQKLIGEVLSSVEKRIEAHGRTPPSVDDLALEAKNDYLYANAHFTESDAKLLEKFAAKESTQLEAVKGAIATPAIDASFSNRGGGNALAIRNDHTLIEAQKARRQYLMEARKVDPALLSDIFARPAWLRDDLLELLKILDSALASDDGYVSDTHSEPSVDFGADRETETDCDLANEIEEIKSRIHDELNDETKKRDIVLMNQLVRKIYDQLHSPKFHSLFKNNKDLQDWPKKYLGKQASSIGKTDDFHASPPA